MYLHAEQNGEAAIHEAGATSGLPLAMIEVYKMMLGGGFDRLRAVQDNFRRGVPFAQAMRAWIGLLQCILWYIAI